MNKVLILRFIHGLFAIYFIMCLIYIYYAAAFSKIDTLLYISVTSLALEGIAVFVLNKGDCPLIHIQKRIGDETPFFRLFLPEKLAKRAIPFFSGLAWLGLALLLVRITLNLL